MLHFMKQLVLFRVGQKAARGFAKTIGLGKLAFPIGLVGGVKSMRHH